MAETKDLLFEIGTEEMPSAPLMNAVKQLSPLMERGLTEAGLAHGPVRVVSSPRRLAVLVDAVATATDEVHEVKRGPAANIAFDTMDMELLIKLLHGEKLPSFFGSTTQRCCSLVVSC